MPLSLRPMPPDLQELVERWIDDDRTTIAPTEHPVFDALFVFSGPMYCCHLKASGDILQCDLFDDVVTTMDDGPDKESTIVCGA
jgi:hypothetical protein